MFLEQTPYHFNRFSISLFCCSRCVIFRTFMNVYANVNSINKFMKTGKKFRIDALNRYVLLSGGIGAGSASCMRSSVQYVCPDFSSCWETISFTLSASLFANIIPMIRLITVKTVIHANNMVKNKVVRLITFTSFTFLRSSFHHLFRKKLGYSSRLLNSTKYG